jgi:hypothetical protein
LNLSQRLSRTRISALDRQRDWCVGLHPEGSAEGEGRGRWLADESPPDTAGLEEYDPLQEEDKHFAPEGEVTCMLMEVVLLWTDDCFWWRGKPWLVRCLVFYRGATKRFVANMQENGLALNLYRVGKKFRYSLIF